MLTQLPKNDSRFYWTRHIKNKMLFYGLSAQRLKSVLRSPGRVEEGIAEGTVAAMQPVKTKTKPEEIWLMYAVKNPKSKIQNPKPK